jgi:hypothetical protein
LEQVDKLKVELSPLIETINTLLSEKREVLAATLQALGSICQRLDTLRGTWCGDRDDG